jgi:HAD superfamily hydrolase (TIGR01509 family)
MPSTQPVLLLDIMSTVVRDPYQDAIPEFFDMSLDELEDVKDPSAWVDFERGLIDEPTFFERYLDGLSEARRERFRQHLYEAYEFIPGMQALLEDLAEAGVNMHALSNYPIWWKIIDEKLDVRQYLDWTFVSARTGFRKPEAEAYLTAARTLKVDPWDCLFVDDRELNCNGARACAMSAIRFEGAEHLRARLAEVYPIDGNDA